MSFLCHIEEFFKEECTKILYLHKGCFLDLNTCYVAIASLGHEVSCQSAKKEKTEKTHQDEPNQELAYPSEYKKTSLPCQV